jgi:hypothetical protein
MISVTLRSFCPQVDSTRYTLNRRLDGPQSWSGRFEETLSVPGIETRFIDSPNRIVVTILTELSLVVRK